MNFPSIPSLKSFLQHSPSLALSPSLPVVFKHDFTGTSCCCCCCCSTISDLVYNHFYVSDSLLHQIWLRKRPGSKFTSYQQFINTLALDPDSIYKIKPTLQKITDKLNMNINVIGIKEKNNTNESIKAEHLHYHYFYYIFQNNEVKLSKMPCDFNSLYLVCHKKKFFVITRYISCIPNLTDTDPKRYICFENTIVSIRSVFRIVNHKQVYFPFSIHIYTSTSFCTQQDFDLKKTRLIGKYQSDNSSKTLHILINPYLQYSKVGLCQITL